MPKLITYGPINLQVGPTVRNLPSPSVEAPKMKTTRTDARFQEYVAPLIKPALTVDALKGLRTQDIIAQAMKSLRELPKHELQAHVDMVNHFYDDRKLPSPPAAAPNPAGLKEGDLVMVLVSNGMEWAPRKFANWDACSVATVFMDQEPSLFKPTRQRQGEWRLPTPAELAAHEGEKEGGWIEWKGGECPVSYGEVIQYRMRKGLSDMPSQELADTLRWHHNLDDAGPSAGDIVAFRILPTTGRD